MLFLFHLHEHLNQRAVEEEEARHLRQELLSQRLRTLLYGTYSLDRDRLDEFELSPDVPQSPSRERTRERLALETDITTWPRDEAILRGEVLALLGAERLLSERCFSGEPLLYPDTAVGLADILSSLGSLVELYEAILTGRPPESE